MPTFWIQVGTLVMFAGLIALAVYFIVVSRREQGQRDRSGDALWDDLRKAHGLSARETRYLADLAQRASLDPASLIFLEPHVLTRLAEKDSDGRAEMREIMSKLYS